MIWIPNIDEQKRGTSVLSHIEGVIAENCGDVLELDEGQASELASAVAMFLEQYQDSGSYVDSGYLVMLASRALSSLGERKAAHRLLVFGSGLVRPSEWEVTGGADVWTLDLRQMTVRDDAALELVFFSSINIVLAAIADVWDGTEGRGVLGLQHVCATATALLGGGKAGAISALSTEIQKACEAKLAQLYAERGWKHIPAVMNLDL
ncbi:MAG: hypothetical protein HN341_17845 [Verrucomicrobia bacterium]|nr:hypothetical protein [Verrucomicrobiota bacterium]